MLCKFYFKYFLKVKYTSLHSPAHPIYLFKGKNIFPKVVLHGRSIIHNSPHLKISQCPIKNEWINRLCTTYNHTINYYSENDKGQLLALAAT